MLRKILLAAALLVSVAAFSKDFNPKKVVANLAVISDTHVNGYQTVPAYKFRSALIQERDYAEKFGGLDAVVVVGDLVDSPAWNAKKYTEIDDWKRLYRKYLKKLGLHKNDTALIDLFYLNDDDIPEMLIKQTSDSLYYIIVTYDGSAIDIVMAPFANLKAVERKNHFMLWGQPDDYTGFAYVLTVQDGAFQWNTHGCFSTKEITEKRPKTELQ